MDVKTEKLLTPLEVMERLRCSKSLVYQLAEEGGLESVRIGGKGKRGKLLIPESSIEKYIREHTFPAKD